MIESAVFQAAFDASPTMSWILAPDGHVLRANRAADAAFPATGGAPPPRLVAALASDHAEVVIGGADGNPRHLALARTPVRDSAGEHVATLVHATDVTEVVSLRTELQTIVEAQRCSDEVRSRFEDSMMALLDSSNEMIAGIDRDLRFVAFNQAFREFRLRAWGREPQIGESALLGVTGDTRRILADSFRRALAGEHVFRERPALAGDGRYLETAFSPIVRGGQVVGCVGISRDVTARTLAERQLRQERSKLKALFDSTRNAVLAVDRNRKATAFNGRWEELCSSAYGVSTVLGATPFDAMARSPREFWCGLVDAALRGESSSFEHAVGIGRGVRYFDVNVHAIIDGPLVSGAAILCLDITPRVRAEQDRSAYEAKLFAVIESTSDPVWSVDRELRVVQFNSACDRLARELGVQVVEGTAADSLLGESDAYQLRGCYERALNGEQFSFEFCVRARHPRTLALSFSPVFASAVVAGIVVKASPSAMDHRA